MSTYFILWDGVPAARWGCQNPPDPSLTVCGEKSSEIRVTWDCGNADFILTAEDVPIYKNARFFKKNAIFTNHKKSAYITEYVFDVRNKKSFFKKKNATFSKFWIQIELLTDYASSQNAKFHVSFSYLQEKYICTCILSQLGFVFWWKRQISKLDEFCFYSGGLHYTRTLSQKALS